MIQFERNFGEKISKVWGVLAMLWIFNMWLNSLLKQNLLTIFGSFVLFSNVIISVFNSIFTFFYGSHLKKHYEQYTNNNVCDYCGKDVQKIKIRSYIHFKTIFCKKCHININLIFIFSMELIVFINFLIFFLFIPPSADGKYFLLGFLFFLILFSITSLYGIIRIFRY